MTLKKGEKEFKIERKQVDEAIKQKFVDLKLLYNRSEGNKGNIAISKATEQKVLEQIYKCTVKA